MKRVFFFFYFKIRNKLFVSHLRKKHFRLPMTVFYLISIETFPFCDITYNIKATNDKYKKKKFERK